MLITFNLLFFHTKGKPPIRESVADIGNYVNAFPWLNSIKHVLDIYGLFLFRSVILKYYRSDIVTASFHWVRRSLNLDNGKTTNPF